MTLIKTNTELEKAASLLIDLKTQYKAITADKEKLTKPLNESLKGIRAKYEPKLTELDAQITALSKAITSYKALQATQASATLDKVLTHTIDPLQAIASITQSTSADKVATAGGSMTYMTTYSIRITDAGAIPREYLDINEARIKTALRAGSPVPGAELISNQIPVIRK